MSKLYENMRDVITATSLYRNLPRPMLLPIPQWPVSTGQLGWVALVSSLIYPSVDQALNAFLREELRNALEEASAAIFVREFMARNRVDIPESISISEKKQFIWQKHANLVNNYFMNCCMESSLSVRFALAWGFYLDRDGIVAFLDGKIESGHESVRPASFSISNCGVWDDSLEGLTEAMHMVMRNALP